MDKDIIATQAHIGGAEVFYKHKLAFADTKADDYPKDYAVPNFGLDRDIVAT